MARKRKVIVPVRNLTIDWLEKLIGRHMPMDCVVDLIKWCQEQPPNELTEAIVSSLRAMKGDDWFGRNIK